MGTTKGNPAPALFPDAVRMEPRKTGILPSQEIHELIHNRKILSPLPIDDSQIQPASIDLRLGNVAYRVQASFLPSRTSTIKSKIDDLKLAEIDLTRPALLERGAVFVIPVVESLALPFDVSGAANPKSTTGRLDIFTRLVTEGGFDFEQHDYQFEQVPKGYKGGLYVEVVSRTFPILLSAGAKLNQLRFVRGSCTTKMATRQRKRCSAAGCACRSICRAAERRAWWRTKRSGIARRSICAKRARTMPRSSGTLLLRLRRSGWCSIRGISIFSLRGSASACLPIGPRK
jgi:deoxycytidine triphosphate deaminase